MDAGVVKSVVNIKDVAKAAGVSIASVSRVLSGSPGVGEDTTKRIRRIMDELGYKPNLGARGLVKRQTGNIAVALPKGTSFMLGNPFFTKVLEGIASVLDNTEYNLILSFTSQQQKRLLETRAVDGILLFAPRNNEVDIQWHQEVDCKMVVIGSSLIGTDGVQTQLPSVRPDDEGGLSKAVHELYRLGHRHIAMVNGPANSMKSKRCFDGYKSAMSELGLEIDQRYIIEAEEFDAAYAKAAVESLFPRQSPVTGIVCSADYLAMGVMKAVSNMGFTIPHDISVVGFGDVSYSEFFIPSLSTVRTDLVGMGKQSAIMLKDLLEGKQLRKKERIFEMEFVARETTSVPRA